MKIIITAPSLDPQKNVSGVSSVVKFIIDNNGEQHYIHFELGKRDGERGGVFRLVPLLRALGQWWRLLIQNPEALIHYSFPLSAASLYRDPIFMWMVRRRRMKIVVHVHGGLYLTAPRIPRLHKWILRKVFAMPVPFISLSEEESGLIREKFGAKDVTALPNCVDLEGAARFQREEKKGRLAIGYLGRIAETKGMEYLLEACIRMKEEGMAVTLEMAGREEKGGEFLPRFSEALGRDFHYWGVVSGQEKGDFMKAIDVLAFPTYFEGLPMSLLECMSYGVVPVTTAVGSIPQYVRDGENGCFIRVKNSESIVSQVKLLNEDRDMLYRLGINARQTIFEQFSPKVYVEKLNALYGRVVENRT